MDGVAEGFGMVRTGLRTCSKRRRHGSGPPGRRWDRLDDIAARDGLYPAQAEPLRQLFGLPDRVPPANRPASLGSGTRDR